MDTKSKSTAGKQVIGFLCFVMSFSIFFSVGLLLLEQPVYGDGRFVLSEAFDGDVQSTQRYQSAVASRFQTLMVDAGADGSFENLSFSSINEDQANVFIGFPTARAEKPSAIPMSTCFRNPCRRATITLWITGMEM